MNSEAEIVIAFLFKRSGKKELTESEIYLPLSIDLGWFTTIESHEFIDYALKQKLLIKKGNFLNPNFDVEQIHIPLGFSPSKKTFLKKEKSEKDNDIIDTIAKKIVENKNQDYNMIIEKIKKIAKEKKIIQEVAVLLVAKQNNIDIEDYIKNVEKKILTAGT